MLKDQSLRAVLQGEDDEGGVHRVHMLGGLYVYMVMCVCLFIEYVVTLALRVS